MRTGVEGCGVVVWFGKYTDIASLVLLFGFTQPTVHICQNFMPIYMPKYMPKHVPKYVLKNTTKNICTLRVRRQTQHHAWSWWGLIRQSALGTVGLHPVTAKYHRLKSATHRTSNQRSQLLLSILCTRKESKHKHKKATQQNKTTNTRNRSKSKSKHEHNATTLVLKARKTSAYSKKTAKQNARE